MPQPNESDRDPGSRAPSNEPTLELLLRARDGDASAWESIDARYRTALIRVAHGRIPADVHRRLDTEDLVQSTLLAAFRGLEGYEYQGPGSLQAWLQKILINRVRQRLRLHLSDRRDARRDVDALRLESRFDLSTMTPGEAVLAAEQYTLLVDAIAGLTEEERRLIVENKLEGRPIQEIASELGIDESTARRRRARVIETLGKKLR